MFALFVLHASIFRVQHPKVFRFHFAEAHFTGLVVVPSPRHVAPTQALCIDHFTHIPVGYKGANNDAACSMYLERSRSEVVRWASRARIAACEIHPSAGIFYPSEPEETE
jgi:hypothetical protein